MQKAPNGATENTVCDQYKGDLMKMIQRKVGDEEVEGGLRGAPLRSYLKWPKIMTFPE